MRNGLTDAFHFLRCYASRRPCYLILFATAVCNARCKHCFYWKEIASADAHTELKLPEIEKLAASLNLIYLSVGGGEPFLRGDLVEVVEAFYRRSGLLYCNIVTNGFYTDRITRAVDAILQRCPRLKLKIQISFDDFDEEHDAYRGVPGLFARALDSLRRLSLDVRAKTPRFNLDVATCLTRTNKKRVIPLHDHLRALVEFDAYQFLYPRGNAEIAGEKDVSVEEYEAALAHAHARRLDSHHNPILAAVNRVARDGVLRFLRSDEHPWPCLAGRKFISITERGILQPCEILPQLKTDREFDLGNLRDFNFNVDRALDTPKARVVKNFIRDTRCRCSFECAANCNVVFSPTQALRAIKTLTTGGT